MSTAATRREKNASLSVIPASWQAFHAHSQILLEALAAYEERLRILQDELHAAPISLAGILPRVLRSALYGNVASLHQRL